MEEESAWRFWYAILQAVVESAVAPNRDRRVTQYTLRDPLLTIYIEKGQSDLKVAKRWDAFNVSVRIVGSTMHVDTAGYEEL